MKCRSVLIVTAIFVMCCEKVSCMTVNCEEVLMPFFPIPACVIMANSKEDVFH